jgi:hypothetical protein
MSPWRAAIDQAVLLQKQPALAAAFRQAALPDGMAVLIRLVSDEGGRRKDLAQLLELDESLLQSVATDYLLSVCLYPGSSDLRSLGLNPAADLSTAKEHHRLLLKWLHPDRNPDNQHFAERVNQAWSAVKKSAKTHIPEPAARETLSEPEAPSSGRFPLFLWGLAGLAALLLALSSMPDSDIYVAGAGSDGQVDAADRPAPAPDSAFEKRLSDLKLSFGEIKSAVLPAAKPEKPRTEPVVEKEQVVRAQAVKPVKHKPDIGQFPMAVAPVPADEQPAKPVQSAPAAMQTNSESRPADAAVPAKVEVAAPPAEAKRDLQAGGQALLAEFRQRYKLGDIDAFMQIFSASARNNRGDRHAIEDDYARFFSNSSSRKIGFSDEKWLFREGVIQFRAKYAASVRRKGELVPETSKGNIEMVMSEDNGKLRIQQILLGN